MPGVAEGIYAQYHDSVIKMAKSPGGVSRPQIMKGLAVTRPIADRLIDECKLRHAKTEGRTDFFKPTKATDKVLNVGAEPAEDDDEGKDATTMIGETGSGQALLGGNPEALLGDELQGKNRLPPQKGAAELDAEIKATKAAISEALEKARQGHQTHLVQTAHANALGMKLQRSIEARLLL